MIHLDDLKWLVHSLTYYKCILQEWIDLDNFCAYDNTFCWKGSQFGNDEKGLEISHKMTKKRSIDFVSQKWRSNGQFITYFFDDSRSIFDDLSIAVKIKIFKGGCRGEIDEIVILSVFRRRYLENEASKWKTNTGNMIFLNHFP